MAETTITILGSGTSSGVPLIGCKCAVCRSKNPKNRRLRASAWVQTQGKSILIDTGPDFREQALRSKIRRIDAVLYTHPHADHCHGIDDLRAYNFVQKGPIPIYGNAWTCEEFPVKFEYIFKSRPVPYEGGGIPSLEVRQFDAQSQSIDVEGISVVPISLEHGKKETVGFRFDSVAYVTDTSYIQPASLERLKGLSVLVLDCVRIEPHRTHLNLEAALEVVEKVRPQKTYLTHLGHEFDSSKESRLKLPRGVSLAYDGLKIRARSARAMKRNSKGNSA
jgi:phosphoribosyl 1,2-cyclic phosphate phosphodiesterase